jgi:hypothetical protein
VEARLKEAHEKILSERQVLEQKVELGQKAQEQVPTLYIN